MKEKNWFRSSAVADMGWIPAAAAAQLPAPLQGHALDGTVLQNRAARFVSGS